MSVANPPTLLLLVERLLRDLPERSSDEDSTPATETCIAEADADAAEALPQGRSRVGDKQEELELGEFLRKAYPVLDLWIRWLLITQRPGATGWGGQAKMAPLGAFQVTAFTWQCRVFRTRETVIFLDVDESVCVDETYGASWVMSGKVPKQLLGCIRLYPLACWFPSVGKDQPAAMPVLHRLLAALLNNADILYETPLQVDLPPL